VARRKSSQKNSKRSSRAIEENNKIRDYRFVEDKRTNIPDAGLASFYKEKREQRHYEYDPHLDPQLVWSGKTEHPSFELDIVALHIHERISTKAILKTVEKKELFKQLKLFGEPELPLDKRIEFYQHDMDWTNRLILGDSLLIMNSLLEREMMAGKVQMIYMDPPYGIQYNSNFQPDISQRDVKDGLDDSLTREPEQIKAYRDTWKLGVHSYLTYIRDRLLLSHELLSEMGSIFVQISSVNIHHVREVLDEVFGCNNFCGLIPFVKTTGQTSKLLAPVCDYLLWYAKNKDKIKYHQLFAERRFEKESLASGNYRWVELPNGQRRALSSKEIENPSSIPSSWKVFALSGTSSQTRGKEPPHPFVFMGKEFRPEASRGWSTSSAGLQQLAKANRLFALGNTLRYVRYFTDFPLQPLRGLWTDTGISGFASDKIFVVQTNVKVIERCILMTSDPGDIVLDPTCGSGTTAYCAEKWGRRWITCDTSRVALFLARQRILTAAFPYYQLAHPDEGIGSDFFYETVPHITLESIAKDESPLEETLFNRPKIDKEITRVSGPFTVEAIPVPSIEDPSLRAVSEPERSVEGLPANIAEDYVSTMIDLIRRDGVTFPGNKHMALDNVRPIESAGFMHAEGQIRQNGGTTKVAVSFGPRHGPVTARQVEEAVRSAYMMGFNVLVLAGFSFDPEASATIQKNPHPNLQIHMASIRPDVEMSDLLKSPKGSQLFTVFGQPDVKIKKVGEEYNVELLGVDIYDPVKGEVNASRPEDIAAWFLDQNYDGYTFCITQAFFPKEATNRNPWDKLENALHGIIANERMEKLRATTSLSFKAGDQKRMAVKVIDQRGNEVIVVKKLVETKG